MVETEIDNRKQDLIERLQRLGLHSEDIELDRLNSATGALVCFPMYMVANVHAWTSEDEWWIPVLDLPGSEALLEAVAIGKQEARFQIRQEHRKVLHSLTRFPRPTDRIVYEFALETLALFLSLARSELSEEVRWAVSRMIREVAYAAGKRVLGRGSRVSREERTCISEISRTLELETSSVASQVLQDVLRG